MCNYTNQWRFSPPERAEPISIQVGSTCHFIRIFFFTDETISSLTLLQRSRRSKKISCLPALLALRHGRSHRQRKKTFPCSHPAIKSILIANFRAVLLQMSLRECSACNDPLQDTDGHSECVACLVATLTATSCSHCENMSLSLLHSCIAFFHEGGPLRPALPFPFSPKRKKQWSSGPHPSGLSEITSDQRPCTSLSLQRLSLPVCFTREDQRPSSAANGLVSFGASEEEVIVDDSMSLTASDAEEWAGSGEEPEAPALSQSARPSVDTELIRILAKAVEELSLDWTAPEEPDPGLLDEWFLKGHRQPSPRRRPAPFLPAVHNELTKTWRAPYSARVNLSTAAALTTIDGAEEKGYSKLPPLEEAVVAHLCPPSTRGLKSAAHPSKPCRMTSALANRAYAVASQAGSALHTMSVLQVFQAKDPGTFRELHERDGSF